MKNNPTVMAVARGVGSPLFQLIWCLLLLNAATIFASAEDSATLTVVSRVSPDYIRPKQADGIFEPEAYTFGEGGLWAGSVRDSSERNLNFYDVARLVARPLLAQNYVPARDSAKTKLLIMLYWGTTTGTEGSAYSVGYENLQASQMPKNFGTGQSRDLKADLGKGGTTQGFDDAALAMVMLENRMRDRANMVNAGMLGYNYALDEVKEWQAGPMKTRWNDLISEIEENRYFVVLMAYDFQLMAKEKKHKLLWETRFSVLQRGNAFDQQLASMAQSASRYFGQRTNGLLRKPLGTDVRLRELKILGEVPAQAAGLAPEAKEP